MAKPSRSSKLTDALHGLPGDALSSSDPRDRWRGCCVGSSRRRPRTSRVLDLTINTPRRMRCRDKIRTLLGDCSRVAAKARLQAVPSGSNSVGRVSASQADCLALPLASSTLSLDLSWSPDGGQLVYVAIPVRFGESYLYRAEHDGAGVVQLTPTGIYYGAHPTWSP